MCTPDVLLRLAKHLRKCRSRAGSPDQRASEASRWNRSPHWPHGETPPWTDASQELRTKSQPVHRHGVL